MELIGRIIQVLEERGGISARTGSEWRLGSFVLETTTDRFPRKMMFEVFGADKLQQFNIQVGEMVRVSFDIDAHEYQGRWYNSIRAWNVDRNISDPMTQAPVVAPMPNVAPFDAPQATPLTTSSPVDAAPFASMGAEDLPF